MFSPELFSFCDSSSLLSSGSLRSQAFLTSLEQS
jgi:hypothetical protein